MDDVLLDMIKRSGKGAEEKYDALRKLQEEPIQRGLRDQGQSTKDFFLKPSGAQNRAMLEMAGGILNRDRTKPGMAGVNEGYRRGLDLMDEIRQRKKDDKIRSATLDIAQDKDEWGRMTDMLKLAPQPAKPPSSVAEYEYAVQQGYKGSFQDFIASKKSTTTVNVGKGESEFGKTVGGNMGAKLTEGQQKAQDAANSLRVNRESRKLLDEGVITGFGANWILGLSKALEQAGYDLGDDKIAATEAFVAQRAMEVAQVIKAFGSGTGLSDKDREYSEKAAAGRIDLDERAIRKILAMHDRTSEYIIKNHNDYVGKLPDKYFGGDLPERDFFSVNHTESTDNDPLGLRG